MVKHTQFVADELFECNWLFCGVGVWRVKILSNIYDEAVLLNLWTAFSLWLFLQKDSNTNVLECQK